VLHTRMWVRELVLKSQKASYISMADVEESSLLEKCMSGLNELHIKHKFEQEIYLNATRVFWFSLFFFFFFLSILVLNPN
jgi:hypothetical protein